MSQRPGSAGLEHHVGRINQHPNPFEAVSSRRVHADLLLGSVQRFEERRRATPGTVRSKHALHLHDPTSGSGQKCTAERGRPERTELDDQRLLFHLGPAGTDGHHQRSIRCGTRHAEGHAEQVGPLDQFCTRKKGDSPTHCRPVSRIHGGSQECRNGSHVVGPGQVQTDDPAGSLHEVGVTPNRRRPPTAETGRYRPFGNQRRPIHEQAAQCLQHRRQHGESVGHPVGHPSGRTIGRATQHCGP